MTQPTQYAPARPTGRRVALALVVAVVLSGVSMLTGQLLGARQPDAETVQIVSISGGDRPLEGSGTAKVVLRSGDEEKFGLLVAPPNSPVVASGDQVQAYHRKAGDLDLWILAVEGS